MNSSPDKSHERRSELRIDEQATIFLEIMSASHDNSSAPNVVICNSLDLSANGIQVAMDDEIAVGSILRLGVDLPDGKDALYLVGEAKWVRRDGDQYLIGFELYDAENTDIAGWKEAIAHFLNETDGLNATDDLNQTDD